MKVFRCLLLLLPLALGCTSTPADTADVTAVPLEQARSIESASATTDIVMAASFKAPVIVKPDSTAPLPIRLVAVPTASSVVSVDFYRGDLSKIGTASKAPYVLQVQVIAAGSRPIIAIGRDAAGAPVEHWITTFTVTVAAQPPPPPPPAPAPVVVLPVPPPAAGTFATPQLGIGWATFPLVLPQGWSAGPLQIGRYDTQTDVKNRWPDGSIRFAIVTAKSDAAGQYPITMALLSAGAFVPIWPSASVTFTIGTQIYTAALPAFASADAWLNGPAVRESRVVVAPESKGVPHPLLQVVFDVRSYVDGGSRVDVTVQNVKDVTAGAPVTYDVAVTVNGSQVYAKAGLTHAYLTRWRKVFGTGLVEATVVHDFEPFYLAGAIPRFLSSVPDLTGTPQQPVVGSKFDPLGYGDMSVDMGAPGGRPEIGPYPTWVAQYLVHKRSEQRAYMLAAADISGSWRGHITEPDGQTFITYESVPDYWLDSRAGTRTTYNGGALGPNAPRIFDAGQGSSWAGGFAWPLETAHMPSLTYIPYLVTGDRYYLDQMKFWSNYTVMSTAGVPRLLAENQTRGVGWAIRSLADLAAYIPDADPLRAYFRSYLQTNLDWLEKVGNTAQGGPFEFVFLGPAQDGVHVQTSLWQNAYVGWALDHAAKQGFGPGAALRDRIVRVQVLFFNSEAAGYPRNRGAPYYPVIGPSGGKFYSTMQEIADASWAADPRVTTYWPEARLMVGIGVRDGVPGAQQAMDYLAPLAKGEVNARSGFAVVP